MLLIMHLFKLTMFILTAENLKEIEKSHSKIKSLN